MNERESALRICQQLDHGAANLPAPVRERLGEARHAALSRMQARHRLAFAFGGGTDMHTVMANGRLVLASLALILLAATASYLKESYRADELADVDVALLADDLPIHAYLDRGFDRWLDDGNS